MNLKMINMNELKIKLEQHTPLLHFQHNQEGVALRATELKPKLDRFIFEHLLEKGETAKAEGWLIHGEENALNYKIKIKQTQTFDKELLERDKFPTFFANMGNAIDKKLPIFYNSLEITFFSLYNGLLDVIKDCISEFFFVTNFGTRQSKGFGSFYPEENSEGYKPIQSIKSKKCIVVSSFIVDLQGGSSNVKKFNNLFTSIDYFTRMIRGGINICKPLCFRKDEVGMPNWTESGVRLCPGTCKYYIKKDGKNKDCIFKQTGSVFYLKSSLQKYLKNKNKQWDKKTIKEVLYNTEYDNSDVSREKGWYLYRDLLGLASESQYGDIHDKVLKSNNDVERFSSPVFIKPIIINENQFKVYVGYRILKNEENILNKQFNINLNIKGTQKNFNISTPEVFNLEEYFNYIFTQINIDGCIGNKKIFFKNKGLKDSIESVLPNSNSYKEYGLIKNIFNELKSNYNK